MKTKTYILFLFASIVFQTNKAQQTAVLFPKVENHLKGELDHVHEALELVQRQINGEEISLGTINTDGTIHFNLPEFNIKALFDSIPLQPNKLQNWFLINSDCKDRDVFAKTPFDDVYAHKYDPIYVKKYGIKIAALYPVSDEKIVSRNNNQGAIFPTEAKYFWFYIDRDIVYKEAWIIASSWGIDNIELAISAKIQFKKGWNFIEENLVEVQNVGEGDSQTTTPKTIEFTKSLPGSKKVKWFINQFTEDKKIQAAKKLYNLTAISKAQFEKWLPEKAGDFKRTSYELDKALDQSRSTSNNVFLVFENGTQKMKITILDGAKNPDDLEMAKFSFAMDEELERKDKPTTDTTVSDTAKGEAHYISKEDKEKKTCQIMSIFKERIVLYASGEKMTAVQLWEGIKALNVESIIK